MFDKMRATSSTLLVRFHTGATDDAGTETARRSKSDTGKRGTQNAGLENVRMSKSTHVSATGVCSLSVHSSLRVL